MDMDGEGFGSALAFEVTPAVLFGVAVGFAVHAVAGAAAQLVAGGLSGLAAFLLAWRCLRLAGTNSSYRLPKFEHVTLEPVEHAPPEDEIDMLPAEEVAPPPLPSAQNPPAAGELLLEDRLADHGPDSRVIRLFQPETIPTPGELQARIARHLGPSAPRPVLPDATDALHEAIAELRRSLR